MATQAELDRAFAWAQAQVGKTYSLGTFGSTFDCSTYMSGIATMIRDGVAKRWFTTHPFHSGARSPLPGWERDLQAPFMIGITADGIGHTGGTLLGVEFEATPPRVRSGSAARGARDPMYRYVYGFRPSILEGAPVPTEDVTYTVKSGDNLTRIATTHGTTIGKLKELNNLANADMIFVGQVLIISKGVPVPPTPTVPQFPGVVKLAEVGPGKNSGMNKIVQSCLNHFVPPVTVDGIWGPKTSAAYVKWQNECGFFGSVAADGKPGLQSMTKLAAKYGFTLDTTAPPAPQPGTEPAHNYTRTTWSGRTINKRTEAMLNEAERTFGRDIVLTQGSYNRGGVSASAGTHDGGGVVDISVSGMSSATRAEFVRNLRLAGFAAWLRTPAQGFAYHIHACAIGDREMSSSAKSQVRAYFNGRNGLANNGRDNSPFVIPAWANNYR